MLQFKTRLVPAISILAFIITVILAFLFSSYELAVSGLLIMVILTAFIPGWRSTLYLPG
jgi:hypothetical protein